jgi:hypothetical protein
MCGYIEKDDTSEDGLLSYPPLRQRTGAMRDPCSTRRSCLAANLYMYPSSLVAPLQEHFFGEESYPPNDFAEKEDRANTKTP